MTGERRSGRYKVGQMCETLSLTGNTCTHPRHKTQHDNDDARLVCGRTGQDRAGQDRTGQDRAGQDRAGQSRTEQDKVGVAGICTVVVQGPSERGTQELTLTQL